MIVPLDGGVNITETERPPGLFATNMVPVPQTFFAQFDPIVELLVNRLLARAGLADLLSVDDIFGDAGMIRSCRVGTAHQSIGVAWSTRSVAMSGRFSCPYPPSAI